MATNIVAPLALTREMLPLLRRAAPSRIVNVGSMFGDIAYPLFAAYSASKFGLRGLSIALRRELKSLGIGVTYAAPRATKTDAASAYDPLVEPMQMRIDEPAGVAAHIWRAVAQDADSAYARGPERLFVLAQRLLPKLVDRAISAQMLDRRIRDYLVKSHEAAKARDGHGGAGSGQPSTAAKVNAAPQGAGRNTHAETRPVRGSGQSSTKGAVPPADRVELQHAT
jgi:hypothetical protein